MGPTSVPPPPRMHLHYCRDCGEKFSGVDDQRRTPHTQVWIHRYQEHKATVLAEYQRCSRNCREREQHEEADMGRRLYGWNTPKKPRKTQAELREQYRKLFPDD